MLISFERGQIHLAQRRGVRFGRAAAVLVFGRGLLAVAPLRHLDADRAVARLHRADFAREARATHIVAADAQRARLGKQDFRERIDRRDEEK